MNAGLFYYREYYANIDLRPKPSKDDREGTDRYKQRAEANKSPLKDANAKLLNLSLQHVWEQVEPVENRLADQHVLLKTTYPGLLTGSGYPHEFRQDEAFMLGCSFDHTTGLPVIPGSSVKGLLRFACKANEGKHLQEMVQKLTGRPLAVTPAAFVNAVFDGISEKDEKQRLRSGDRDLFFDALPIISANQGHRLLGDDFITPHLHKQDRSMDGLKNPVPIKFLKVLPDVTFDFRFHLEGIKGGLTVEERKTLFENILLLHGIGAKTNVGYGQFIALSKEELVASKTWQKELQEKWQEARQKAIEEKAEAEQREKDVQFKDEFDEDMPKISLSEGHQIEDATIVRIVESNNGRRYYIQYFVDGQECQKELSITKFYKEKKQPAPKPNEGDQLTLTVTTPYNIGDDKITIKARIITKT